MKSPRLWGMVYLFMAVGFTFLAIQQKSKTDEWDLFTLSLTAIAAYDLLRAIRYLTYKNSHKN